MRLILTLLGVAVLLLAAAITFKLIEFVPDPAAAQPAVAGPSAARAVDTPAPAPAR